MITSFDFAPRAKLVAIIYGAIAALGSIFGAGCSGLMRIELMNPEHQHFENAYFSLVTSHGFVFVFYVLAPIGQAYLNHWLPGLVGVEDFYLPRANVAAAILTAWSGLALLGLWAVEGSPFGWTLYPPLTLDSSLRLFDCVIASLHLLAIAGLTSAVNTLATIGLSFNAKFWRTKHYSLFVWSQGLSALMFLLTAPGLALAITGLLLDRSFGTCWFDPVGGGDPVLFQTLFWYFGHPEVYILILPAFATINMVFEAQGRLFSRPGILASLVCLGTLASLVYGHHMFTVELELEVQLMFSASTMSIGIPTGVKVFSWLMSMRYGKLSSPTAVTITCFMITFVGGGITGVMVSACSVDVLLHDTAFVVAHFHQVLAIASFLGFAVGTELILPLTLISIRPSSRLVFCFGVLSFTLGTFLLFIPMYHMGLQGVPRRSPAHATEAALSMPVALLGFFLAEVGALASILAIAQASMP